MTLSFEQILAEAQATVAQAKAKGKPKASFPIKEDPARENLLIPSRLVYAWYSNQCTCGNSWDEFDGVYEERRHPKLHYTSLIRLPALPEATNTLPREDELKSVFVPYCKECAYATPEVSKPEHQDPRDPATGDDRQA
jgi:hypothetical protein